MAFNNANMDFVIETIRSNSKPKSSRKIKYPCSICNKAVLDNQKAIQCDTCDLWCHIKCDGTSNEKYNYLMLEENSSESWHCLVCIVEFNHCNIPFTLCDINDIENINCSNSMQFFEYLPKFEIVSEVSKFSNLAFNEIDLNLSNRLSC